MATWVKFARAMTLPRVQKVWATTQTNRDEWRKAIIANASGAATFARYASGTSHSGDLNIEVDITNANVAVQ